MDQQQLERLHTIDRWYEQGEGQPPETMLELRKLVARIFEVNGELRVRGGGLAIKVPGLKKVPPDIVAGLEKKWHILVDLLERSSEKVNSALNGVDPTDWEELRGILIEWFSLGVSPTNLIFSEEDGTEVVWVFEIVGDGISGHQADGKRSFFWSQENELQWWYSPVIN